MFESGRPSAVWHKGRWIYPDPPPEQPDPDDIPTNRILFPAGGSGADVEVSPPPRPSAAGGDFSYLPGAAGLGSIGCHLSTRPRTVEAYDGQDEDRRPPADIYRPELRKCHGHIEAYGHPDRGEGAHRWFIPRGCCGRADCGNPGCVARRTRDRARRVMSIYDRLQATVPRGREPLRMGCLVFTFPAELRDHLRSDDGRKMALAAAWDCATWWAAAVNGLELEHRSGRRRYGWRFAGVSTWHPEGDGMPGDWHPHIHLEIPAWAWTGEPDCDCAACRPARWARLRVRVTEADIRLLHRMWSACLAEYFGWRPPADLFGRDQEAVDVDYKYRSRANPARYQHRIRYDFRHWPRYRGGWRRVRWHGYLAPRAQAMCGLVDAVELDQGDHERVCYLCPLCGERSAWDREIGAAWGCVEDALIDARAPPWVLTGRTVH